MTHVSVLHPDNTMTYYDVGPGVEFRRWKIVPQGLIFYRHDGSRMQILPASIVHFNIHPCVPKEDEWVRVEQDESDWVRNEGERS